MTSLVYSSSRCTPDHYEGDSDSPDLLQLHGVIPHHSVAMNPEHPTLHIQGSIPGMGC